jgi:hypothetical protein
LQESYEQCLRRGLADSQAFDRALGELGDIGLLVGKIASKKREGQDMGDRMKTFWLPGLAGLAAFNLLWMVVTRAGIPPRVFDFRFITVPVDMPLLVAMPLLGVLGAYLSLRAGGSRGARFAAGLFPLLAAPIAILTALAAHIVGIVSLSRSSSNPHDFPTRSAVAGMALAAFVIQAAALLLGALPFLRASKRGRPTA